MSKIQFTPKTKSQIQQEEKERQEQFLWPVGEYPYEITKARAKTSKEKFDNEGNYKSGGKPMIELALTIFKDEQKQYIYDYLLTEGQFAFKLRHAAYAVGLGKDYESGNLDAGDFEGKTGIVKIGIQKASGDYPAKNNVLDYVLDAASSVEYTQAKTEKAQAVAPELNDEIPW